MNIQNIFITGTDTDVGKSIITLAFALYYESKGLRVGVYKPLQSGAFWQDEKLIAPDLALIQSFSSCIKTKCSYLLEGECSPALAMKMANVSFSLEKVVDDYQKFCSECDIVLVEGAGGLLCPVDFTKQLTMADIIKVLALPCYIVARPNLGTINHTLLTDYVAKEKNLTVQGIIINKYPKETQDIAIQNVCLEIEKYTSTPIKYIIPKFETITKEKLIDIVDKVL